MSKIENLIPVFVEYIPRELEEGNLYISEKYKTTSHLCACGCGNRTVMATHSKWWTMKNENGKITFSESVGNFCFACRLHYFIRDNKIVWC